MGDLQIVGLGLATLDVLVRLRDMPTWEQGTRLSAFGFDGGGPVGTAMVAAARLGARVGFIGTAGNDEAAELKSRFLARDDVDLSRMVRYDGPEDQSVLVCVHAETGERVFSGLGQFGRRALRVEELDCDYITSAEWLHLDGCHDEAALQAAQWMRAAGKKVMLDAAKTDGEVRPPLRRLLEHVDVLICGSGFGPAVSGKADLCEAGRAILDMGPSIVVQTEGEDGSYTSTRDAAFHVPAFEVPVIDTTGAGDVFHGAYLVGLLHGWNVRDIALFSTAVSALKCTKLGGRGPIPRFHEVMAFLRERNIHIP